MKRAKLQWKLTCWFSAALLLMALLTFVIVFFVSHSVLQKNLKDELIHTVEDNLDEVEFYRSVSQMHIDGDTDHYIRYGVGYLEIDDDFLDQVNGICTGLYRENGELLYGENPITEVEIPAFADGVCHTVRQGGEVYYLFDRQLEQSPIRELWLRGVVAESQADAPLRRIVRICLWCLGAMVLFAIGGGVAITRRALRPIRDLSQTAAQISGGDDLKKRIPAAGNDELSQLAGAFNGMIQRLDEAFEAERQFASDASHELRTPMAVILAQCDEAMDAELSPEEYRQALRVIRRQGRRMNRMIAGMLECMRMERKSDLYAREDVDLSELTESLCQDLALIGEKGIQVTWEVEDGIHFTGDRTLLSRLIANLVGNAYRYGRENGHTQVTLNREGEHILLSVADDGIGIAPDQQEKIFRRLYQGASHRNGEGVGLGLSMARQIARMYGGEIAVKSTPGAGSTFTVRLPAK